MNNKHLSNSVGQFSIETQKSNDIMSKAIKKEGNLKIFNKNFQIQKDILLNQLYIHKSHFKKNQDTEKDNKTINKQISNHLEKNILNVPSFSNKRAILTGSSKIHELKLITIGLASPEKIQQWAEKVLPNGKVLGEVTNANTLHYKTFKPTKGGLFCERIFGPLKDFECACGTRQKPTKEESEKIFDHLQTKRTFCSDCDVEYTRSIIRRYQLGYIRLVSPVSHLWYLKANPSYLSILLDIKRKKLESIIYCIETTTIENVWKSIQTFGLNSSPSLLYFSWKEILEEEKFQLKTNPRIIKTKKQTNRLQIKAKKLLTWRSTLAIQKIDSTFIEKFYSNKNFSTTIIHKIDLKIKKQLFPILWTQIWKVLWKKVYLKSLLKNSKIVKIVWLKYLKNKKRSQQKNLLDNNILSNQFYWKYLDQLKSLTKKTTFLNYSNIEKPGAQHLAPGASVPALRPVGPGFLNKNSALRPLNPLLINYTFDSYLKTYFFYDKTLLNRQIFTDNINNSFSLNLRDVNLNQINTLKKQNKIWVLLNQNYVLIHFLKFLQMNQKMKKFLTLWLKVSNLQNKNKLIKKMTAQFFPNLTSISKTMVSNLSKIQLKKCLTSILSIYHYNADNPKFIMINRNKSHFIDSYSQLDNSMLQNFQKICSKLFTKYYLIQQNNQHILKDFNFYYNFNIQNWNLDKNRSSSIFPENYKKILFSNKTLLSESQSEHTEHSAGELVTGPIGRSADVLASGRSTEFLFKNPGSTDAFASGVGTLFETSIEKVKERFFSVKSNLYLKKALANKNKLKVLKIKSPTNFLSSNFNLKILKSNINSPSFNFQSKLINNSYCISYLYSWDLDRDWKYFLYYNFGPPNFEDCPIPFYKNRTINNLSELSGNMSLTGAALIQKLLSEFQISELKKMSKQHRILLPRIRKKIRRLKSHTGKISKTNLTEIEKLLKKRDHIMRRLKIIRKIFRKSTNSSSMILSKLPVLPPDLRPILKMQDQIAASDLNTLYQRIIFRNDRLKKFLKDPAISQSFEAKYAQRLLQEAVDNLIQNGKGSVKPETNKRGQPLKSLSEILKGKQGRFRQYLLGKRVDYSGRSVIIVGPKLKLHECGLPKEMALELFLPFLIKRILHYKLAATIIGAKTLIKNKELIIWDLLREVMQNHPILLNRAPTLHRLGIQAFQPKLIEGRAILIHPLVCPGFNADFDGDQMAVHVPLTVEARIEAWKLMFSGNNLISPATGEPIILPSQDMVLGCYYLTTEKIKFKQIQKRKLQKCLQINSSILNPASSQMKTQLFSSKFNPFYNLQANNFLSTEFLPTDFCFSNIEQVLKAYQLNRLDSHTSIWLKWNGFVETKSFLFEPIELQIDSLGYTEEIKPDTYRRFDSQWIRIHQFIRTTPGKVFFNTLIQNHLKE